MIPIQYAIRRRSMQRSSRYTLTIIGSLSAKYGYVTINGQKYISAQTLLLASGTEITVTLSGLSRSSVEFNGDRVATGVCSYSFILTANATIAMSHPTDNSYQAVITMPT